MNLFIWENIKRNKKIKYLYLYHKNKKKQQFLDDAIII